ncbi:MAG: energy transducer TonB [Rhodothermales bacterium]|nr:energy transducer TonB [Rhodothermales bacterium]
MRNTSLSAALSVALLTVALTGCGPGDMFTPGPPDGWMSDGNRWFLVGVDTTGLFRNLESLESMSVVGAELTYASDMQLSRRRSVALKQLARAVKLSLIALIRNEPAVVDSLFEKLVVPKLKDADLSHEPDKLVERYKKEAYRTIARHFREPRATFTLGRDIPVDYPDSLRKAGVSGRVELQVHINDKGEPDAIEKLGSVHPVLDDIAMVATTKVRWQPAYLLRIGKSYPIASWARFNVNFQTQ